MNSVKLSDWLQIAGLFGVIVSLAFVVFEMRQTHKIALGHAYQARTELITLNQAIFFRSEHLPQVIHKANIGEPLTDFEAGLLDRYQISWLSYYENNHFQFEDELLSEDHWLATRNTLKGDIRDNPLFVALWNRTREKWRASFAEVVDDLILEVQAE